MKRIPILLFLMTGLFFGGARVHAGGGSTVGNGGSVVIDGKTYQLADLHFVPLEYDRFEFDPELKNKLESIRDLLRSERFFGSGIRGSGDKERDLFNDEIFNQWVEYRLVRELPSDCKFIPSENLPLVSSTVPIACTKGKLTYLLPDYFSKLDLLQKALLIIHERLHALYPNEPYELKVDVIRALNVLAGRYQSALESMDSGFSFTDEELRTVRILPLRLNQLSGEGRIKWDITREGGTAREITGKDVHIDLLSSIGGRVAGDSITIRNSRAFNVVGGRILISDVGASKDRVPLSVQDSFDVAIVNSRVDGHVLESSNIVIEGYKGMAYVKKSSGVQVRQTDVGVLGVSNSSEINIARVQLGHFELWVEQTKKLLLNDLSVLELDRPTKMSTPLRISGSDVSVVESSMSPAPAYCTACQSGWNQTSEHTIHGENIHIQRSRLGAAVAYSPAESRDVVSIATQVLGKSIRLDSAVIQGGLIEGERLDLQGIGVQSNNSFRNPWNYSASVSGVRGARVTMDSNFVIKPGTLVALEDVSITGSSFQGFEWAPLELKNVRIQDVHLIATQPAASLMIANGIQMSDIPVMTFDRKNLTFGVGSGSLVLDGLGLRYHVKKGGFWDRDNVTIGSQKDLSRWAE